MSTPLFKIDFLISANWIKDIREGVLVFFPEIGPFFVLMVSHGSFQILADIEYGVCRPVAKGWLGNSTPGASVNQLFATPRILSLNFLMGFFFGLS